MTTVRNSSQPNNEKSKEQTIYENNDTKNTPTKKTPPKLTKIRKETPKNDKNKKTGKTPKNTRKPNKKQQEQQKSVQQLRGFWTAYAMKQKEKSENSAINKDTHKKISDKNTVNNKPDFSFEVSPNPTSTSGPGPGILERSMSEKKISALVQPKITQFEKRKFKSSAGTT